MSPKFAIATIDRCAGTLVVIIGLVHLAVGRGAFVAPTNGGIWFLSAGFLLVTTGLANIAASGSPSRLQSAAAASGSLAVLVLGALIARVDPGLLLSPQTLILLGLGSVLTALRLRDLLRRHR
ncbi:MAG: hypothetical protein JWO25_1837 [Alphaproteobacteria bacterium]|nr:hypothetical protein [Alphaproteobacteria bacterium]MDB5721218.1 hypothetical protein [Alphaproteobacteria bacterium]